MIITACPYCDTGAMVPLNRGRPGIMERRVCENEECARVFWVEHLRYGYTYSDEEFRAEFNVDDATKMIVPKDPAWRRQRTVEYRAALVDQFGEEFVREMENGG